MWPLNVVGRKKIYGSPRKSGDGSENRGERSTEPGNDRVALGNRVTNPRTGDTMAPKMYMSRQPSEIGPQKKNRRISLSTRMTSRDFQESMTLSFDS